MNRLSRNESENPFIADGPVRKKRKSEGLLRVLAPGIDTNWYLGDEGEELLIRPSSLEIIKNIWFFLWKYKHF